MITFKSVFSSTFQSEKTRKNRGNIFKEIRVAYQNDTQRERYKAD